MKANFIIELNEKHSDAMNKTKLMFNDVDISIIPNIGWCYEYVDYGYKSYYGKVIGMEVHRNQSTNEEELYITIEGY